MSDGDTGAGARHGAETASSAAAECVAEDPEPPSGRSGAEELHLDIIVQAGDWSAFCDAEDAARRAGRALARAQAPSLAGREATIVLADDALLRTLNRTYRGKDAPTNVLSFPFQAPPGADADAARGLGDVILAAETVLREAEAHGLAANDHLQHLVIHGLLHLVGFDHMEEAEAQRMEAVETAVLAELGIADPYAAD